MYDWRQFKSWRAKKGRILGGEMPLPELGFSRQWPSVLRPLFFTPPLPESYDLAYDFIT